MDAEVHDIAVAIRERWESDRESPFASIVVDHVERLVKVYRVSGDARFDVEVQSRGSERVRVVVVDAPRNRAANEAIRDAIMARTDLPIRVCAAGLRSDGGGVDLLAEGDVDAAQTALDQVYGPGTVLVEEGRVIPLWLSRFTVLDRPLVERSGIVPRCLTPLGNSGTSCRVECHDLGYR